MGRTAHSAGCSVAQTTRSTLPAPLSNATRYGSTPTIGELRYAQPVKERPELRTTPDTQPSPHPLEQPSVLARLAEQPKPPPIKNLTRMLRYTGCARKTVHATAKRILATIKM